MTKKEMAEELRSCLLEYRNERTGEVTYSHKEAVGWYNEGDDVSLWTERKRRWTWIH